MLKEVNGGIEIIRQESNTEGKIEKTYKTKCSNWSKNSSDGLT